jgi:hypothetical protein
MEQGEQAHIIPFRQRYVERINGIKLDLGRMSLLELLLENQCNERFKGAHHGLVVVRMCSNSGSLTARRFPDESYCGRSEGPNRGCGCYRYRRTMSGICS